MSVQIQAGAERVAQLGWLRANKWLILRRSSQLGILGLFMLGPLAGIWAVKGNLAASLTLDVLPLTDPYVLLQSLLAGHRMQSTALVGALIVVAFYFLVGGRVYCSWVCPVNIITDAAYWLRRRLGIKGQGMRFSPQSAYWVLAMTLVLALLTGSIAWELVNPVSMLYRGLLYGIGLGWALIIGIFLFDLLVSRRGWCAHLCPVGVFYGLIGSQSIVRVSASRREQCNDCMDCFSVCPEPQVIKSPLKNLAENGSPIINSGRCTNCARCIDVCNRDVFSFTTRFNKKIGIHSFQA